MDKIHVLLSDQNPDIEELLQLGIQQDRQEQQLIQANKDKQVLQILRAKDADIAELQQNNELAMEEIEKLLKKNEEAAS